MPKAKTVKYKLDMMSITVLLVMAIFGGLVGYYIGRASLATFVTGARDTSNMMQTVGQMMEQRGKKYNDKDLRDTGTMMMEKANTMLNMMSAY